MKGKVALFLLTIFLTTGPVFCDEVIWNADSEGSNVVYVDGVKHRTIYHDGLLVSFSGLVNVRKGSLLARLYFRSFRQTSIDINPVDFRIEITRPEPRTVKALEPDYAMRQLTKTPFWKQMAAASLAGAATGTRLPAQSETSGTVTSYDSQGNIGHGAYSGTTVSQTDQFSEGTKAAQDLQKQISEMTTCRAKELSSTILRRYTLLPTAQKSGDVYFNGLKEATEFWVVIPLDNHLFKFSVQL